MDRVAGPRPAAPRRPTLSDCKPRTPGPIYEEFVHSMLNHNPHTRRTLLFLVLCLTIGLAAAQDKGRRMASSNYLAEAWFALDDRPARSGGHTVVGFYIANGTVGMYRLIYNWANQGVHSPDTNAVEKAAECMKLLRALGQPNGLPESPNRILIIRCADGRETVERKFPIDQVPPEVRRILTIMGCGEEGFKRLKFLQKPEGSITNEVPHIR